MSFNNYTEKSFENDSTGQYVLKKLKNLHLDTLEQRNKLLCSNLFCKIKSENDKIHGVLPISKQAKYDLRKSNNYVVPKCSTNRYKNSIVPYAACNI